MRRERAVWRPVTPAPRMTICLAGPDIENRRIGLDFEMPDGYSDFLLFEAEFSSVGFECEGL